MTKRILLFLVIVFFVSSFSSVFAEVMEFRLDKEVYFINDSIFIEGTVTEESSGFVTIVIRDPYSKFLLLSQAMIQSDNKFQKEIPIDSKFEISGTYNATAFVLNMTDARFQSFDVLGIESQKNAKAVLEAENNMIDSNLNTDITNSKISESKINEYDFKFSELTYENTNPFIEQTSKIADFVDATKNPQYYLDRYYNEPAYKSWFDRNYPDLTIEEAAGYKIPKKELPTQYDTQIIPQAEASLLISSKDEKNEDVGLTVLTISGLGILFAAVYGIKKKSDGQSKLISINKEMLKKRFSPSRKKTNPRKIIQVRLANGEITVDEYEKLKNILDEKY